MARSTTYTPSPNRVGNYVTPQVGNYVIANPALVGNFMIADTVSAAEPSQDRCIAALSPITAGSGLNWTLATAKDGDALCIRSKKTRWLRHCQRMPTAQR